MPHTENAEPVTVTADLRRLLGRPPSSLLKATAPDLAAALPLLVQFFDAYDALAERVVKVEKSVGSGDSLIGLVPL